jgi:hypothetical protein
MSPFTLDTLLEKSDFILCKRGSFWYKNNHTPKVLYTDSIHSDIYTAKTLFLFGCEIKEWSTILQKVSTLKLLIIGGTDIPFVNGTIQHLLTSLPSTNFWITNWLGNHPRCTLLPLFPSYYAHYSGVEQEKTNLFGIPFLQINSVSRIEFYESLQKVPEVHPYLMKELSTSLYQKAVSSLYFCCCPMGNGFDTHRFWESLYFGAIPIVKNHPFYDALLYVYPNIPMIFIDEWENLPSCIESLSIERYNTLWSNSTLELLTTEFWNSKFSAALS